MCIRDNHLFLYNKNNNFMHLYSAFLDTQNALQCEGVSPHPPPVCNIHMDDATAAIVRQNAHHTPAYWWRGDRVMNPINRFTSISLLIIFCIIEYVTNKTLTYRDY